MVCLWQERADKAFKISAVKLVLESGIPVSEVSKEFSIHYNSLYCWISEYEKYKKVRFQNMGPRFIYVGMKSKK